MFRVVEIVRGAWPEIATIAAMLFVLMVIQLP